MKTWPWRPVVTMVAVGCCGGADGDAVAAGPDDAVVDAVVVQMARPVERLVGGPLCGVGPRRRRWAAPEAAVRSLVVVVVDELVEEVLQFVEVRGVVRGEPFLEGLWNRSTFAAGLGVIGPGVTDPVAEGGEVLGERRTEYPAVVARTRSGQP